MINHFLKKISCNGGFITLGVGVGAGLSGTSGLSGVSLWIAAFFGAIFGAILGAAAQVYIKDNLPD